MSKITLNDNLQSAIIKMADENPGAMNVLMQLAEKSPEIDPDNGLGPFGNILNLDTFEVYGSAIYVLYCDKCDSDIRKVCLVIRATQMGMFPRQRLLDVCSDQMRQVNITDEEFTKMENDVTSELKNFKKAV